MTFLILSIIIFNIIALKIPKRLTKSEMYQTCLFSAVFQLITDLILDLRFQLYGYFKEGADLSTFLVIFGVYPAVNIIFLNYYPVEKGIKKKSLYIFFWSIFITLYEWASIEAGYFYYNEWNLWYSFMLYPFVLLILLWNLRHFRRLNFKGRIE